MPVRQKGDGRAVPWLLLAACGTGLLHGCDDPSTRADPPLVVQNPYDRGGTWYKADFHLHSTHSHGLMTPGELAALYASAGYRVLAITDHNCLGDQDGGRLAAVQTDTLLHDWNGDGRTYPEYVPGSGVEAYVRDWSVEPPAYHRERWFRPADASIEDVPLLLPGFEASYAYFGAHFGLVGFPPGAIDPPRPGFEWLARSRAAGGFAYIAHPSEGNAIATRFAAAVPVGLFDGIEIVNGLQLSGGVPADATPLWDSLLTRGYELWGLANDDAHQPPGAAEQFPFTAFDMVLCQAPTAEAVLVALHRGAFYASTGLLFEELRLDGTSLYVRVPGAEHVRFVGAGGHTLAMQAGEDAVYRIQGDEGYVRVEAMGAVVVAPHASWQRALWSQPLRVSRASDPSP